ncbi:MAG: hypothetical protein ACOY94_17645 [Bacillota bacterium]
MAYAGPHHTLVRGGVCAPSGRIVYEGAISCLEDALQAVGETGDRAVAAWARHFLASVWFGRFSALDERELEQIRAEEELQAERLAALALLAPTALGIWR